MIGIFLGSTNFPKKILINKKKKKLKYFIIDLTKNNIFKKDKYSNFINIGKFGKILDLINKKNVKKFYLLERLKNLNFQILDLI